METGDQNVVTSNAPFYQERTYEFNRLYGRTRFILYRILDPTTDAAAATVVGGDFVMPFGGTIEKVGATVDTAGTTNTLTVDINKGGTTILSTKITIDSTEKTSRTAATPPVISVRGFSEGDIFTFDIDAVHTTASKGLTVFIRCKELTR